MATATSTDTVLLVSARTRDCRVLFCCPGIFSHATPRLSCLLFVTEASGAHMKYAVTVVVALALIAAGCKVNKPGSMESKVMTEVKQKVTVGGKDDQSPVPDTGASVEEGKGHFGHHCQICHGLDGQNTGVPF